MVALLTSKRQYLIVPSGHLNDKSIEKFDKRTALTKGGGDKWAGRANIGKFDINTALTKGGGDKWAGRAN